MLNKSKMTEVDKHKFIINIRKVAKKFAKINKYIEEGKEIPKELTKNFITFELVDDPYKDL
jgi:hypothetical protein